MSTPNIDPNHGAGGAYVINPKTGERELAERTVETVRGDPLPPQPAPQALQPAEE